jgi:hypothetical protein
MHLGRWEGCSIQIQRLDNRGFIEEKDGATSESVLDRERIGETRVVTGLVR